MIFGWQNIIYDVGLIFTTTLLLGLSFFTYTYNRKSKDFTIMSVVFLLGAIFSLSQLIGISISDPVISKYALMFSVLLIWIGVLQIHAIRIYLGKKGGHIMHFLYTFISVFTAFFLIKPSLYLLDSVPISYFVNYYNPGLLYIFEIVFVLLFCIPYCIYLLYSTGRKEKDLVKRRYYFYFIFTIIAYFIVTHIPFLLAFGININPLYGTLIGVLFTLYLAHNIEKHDVMSIKGITKQSLIYTIVTISLGIVITTIHYGEDYLRTIWNTPTWTLPLLFSFISVTSVIIIWRYMHRGEVMKGEFMSVVTHKLRAPLTHIRWASENLVKSQLTRDQKEELGYITSANEKLIELTDMLVNISNTENTKYLYHFEKTNLTSLAKEIVDTVFSQQDSKKIRLVTHYSDMLPVNIDSARIRFVMQTFLENAMHYTPEDSEIEIYCYRDDKYAVFSVRDNGIGISKEELPLLFRKFYRSEQAKKSDSDGMGIALFMSREIIEKHKGRIWAESKGQNMGSTFNIAVPISKS